MNMKNTKTKIILSAIIFLSVVGFVGTAVAAVPSLYVSPASLTKTVGDTFSVSVGFNASGSKVCAIEGTLVFDNLTCQSIIVADDVMAQSSPTCSNPHFLIGVPSCVITDKALFTVLVKAGSAGMASISFTGVDIIGEGASVGSASISGNYTINAVSKLTPASTPPLTSVSTPTSATPIISTAPVVESTKEEIVLEEETSVVQEPTTAPQPIASQPLLAGVGSIITLGTDSVIVGLLVAVAILALIGYAIYAVIQRARRKNFGKAQ